MGLYFKGEPVEDEKVIKECATREEIEERSYVYEHLGDRVWLISGSKGSALVGDEGNGWVIVLEKGNAETLIKHSKKYRAIFHNLVEALKAIGKWEEPKN